MHSLSEPVRFVYIIREDSMSVDMPFTDAALKKATGKDWLGWKTSLEEWGVKDKSYRELHTYLSSEFGLNDWWAQGIAVGYERMTVQRLVGQLSEGTYSTSINKTINASIELTHSTIVVELMRYQWLDASVVRLRTSLAPHQARFDDYEAKVIITFSLTKEDEDRCSLELRADKLPSAEAGEQWKAAWESRLERLAEHLDRKVTA